MFKANIVIASDGQIGVTAEGRVTETSFELCRMLVEFKNKHGFSPDPALRQWYQDGWEAYVEILHSQGFDRVQVAFDTAKPLDQVTESLVAITRVHSKLNIGINDNTPIDERRVM